MRKILFLLFFTTASVFADETSQELFNGVQEGQSYNFMGEFVNMLLTLGFIMVMIFATVFFLKKYMRSRVQTLNKSNGIKILERRPLNNKSSLYLVDILGKGVVISESQAGIHVITEFSEDVHIDQLLDQLQGDQNSRVSFSESFTKKMRKLTSRNA
ncbi:MAG: hypothetical protein S4CHLAM123_02200 [Chlamydiales bacterium]|nr:hypothetical protein [Chlamydiales bacterium]